ncbi:MAG: SMC-Scp complex subunit ScpB [archaeon]
MSEASNQVEALLFSSGRAMNVEDIAIIMNFEKKEVKNALKELKEKYDLMDGSIMVAQEGDSWKLNIKEKYASLVMKIIADTEMSKTVLETLSVIAWKSPVLQSEVIRIRTSNAYEHIKELVDAGFINKEREGRSYRLRIAEKFFEYFDVPGDKGIKAAFKEIKIPEKREPEHLGTLEVVPLIPDEEKKKEVEERIILAKKEIPPIDEDFLSRVNDQIRVISAKNDELEQDELFKRKTDETTEEKESSEDEYVEETNQNSGSEEESPEEIEEEFVEEELTEEKKELKDEDENIEELEESLKEESDDTNESLEEKKKENASS